jgi:hypothetical protein
LCQVYAVPALRGVVSRDLLHTATTGDARPTAGVSLLAEVAPHCTLMVAAMHGIHGYGQFLLSRKR